ncbi:MAG: hypothetical protein WDM85_02945 [Caulobacteraceae bacterium]
MKLGEKAKTADVESVSTGSLGLDIALGIGGLPRGRIVEIYGPEARARPRWLCTWWRRCRSWAARRPSSTPSMRWILPTPTAWGEPRRPAGLAAGHRRAGAGDHRHAGALGAVWTSS